jgi:hypothetical protein
MKSGKIILLLIIFISVIARNISAQDFGFGFDDEAEDSGTDAASRPGTASGLVLGSGLSVKMGGEIAVEMTPYVHDFREKENGQTISFWDMVSYKLNFTLSGPNVEAYSSLNINSSSVSELWNASPDLSSASYTPLIIDEAFLRAYVGPVNVEAGFRKLAWGKADSLGPLDVTNPLDYSDLRNISDIKAIKIARPMLHLTWNTGNFSKLEAVFIPNFSGHRFAQEGRWKPAQFTGMPELVKAEILGRLSPMMAMIAALPLPPEYIQGIYSKMAGDFSAFPVKFPDTSGLSYFQTGFRYTATIGPADIGGQYFYGNLFQPDFTIAGIDDFVSDLTAQNIPLIFSGDPDLYQGDISKISPQIKYNRYHQIGVDYAQVLFGFNLRSEFAVHITEDLSGDDGSVRNPFIGWSFGFDRELVWGIYANVQINETIRLLNDKVGANPVLDSEAGTNVTATRLTVQLSKKYLRDNLESKVAVIWDMENSGCYVIPAIVWITGGLTTELSAGIFAGKEDSDLGQYWENSFVRVGIKYSF